MGTGTKTRPQKLNKTKDGRDVVRSDSAPRDSNTYFTMRGDSANAIGDGNIITWDFSNSDNIVTDSLTIPIPGGYKRKRIQLDFVDEIYIKEGALFWENAPFGCHVDFWVICPAGEYYLDRDGVPNLATVATPITHYVNHYRMLGTCHMGDELNTEGANENPIPSNYKLWVEITTLNTDNSFRGHAELEIYRARTHLLPGEEV